MLCVGTRKLAIRGFLLHKGAGGKPVVADDVIAACITAVTGETRCYTGGQPASAGTA